MHPPAVPAAPPASAGARARGFTILEVLLTIALIALLSGVLVGGAAHLLSDKPVTADEVFWKAVQEARKAALKSEKEVRLRFDAQKKQFVLIDGFAPSTLGADGFTKEETVIKQIPVPPPGSSDLAVDFLGTGKGGPAILIGGVMIESQPLAYVTFYPDGTCSAFRAQFVRNGGTHVLSVDQWTCAAMLLADSHARTL